MRTSIKPVLWTYKPLKSGLFTIKLQIIRNRKIQYISTPFHASVKQWDAKSGRVFRTHPNFEEVNDHIETMLIDTQNMYKVSKTVNPVVEIRRKQAAIFDVPSFMAYLKSHLERLEKKGQFGTRKKYNTLLNHLLTHLGEKIDLFFHEIDKAFLEDFELYLRGCGVNINGTHTYFKGFKMLYNKAVDEELFTPERNPFKKFRLPDMEEVEQRHLSEEQLHKILRIEIIPSNDLFNYKNYFLFQIFAQGMRVSDINLLRWSNCFGSSIKYQMLKTKTKIELPCSANMLKILRFYTGFEYTEFDQYHKRFENNSVIVDPGMELEWKIVQEEFYKKILADMRSLAINPKTRDKFIFPILNPFDFPAEKKTYSKKQYGWMEAKNSLYNQNLKILAERTGLENIQLSTHYCRHTFTHLMILLDADIYDISKCLGHSDLSTTAVYADKFNLPRTKRVSEKLDALIKV